jgi:hypothetical protein
MMSVLSFQKEIESHSGRKLKLKINDNRSTMLSVKWEPDCTKVSMHRIFLNAPQNVMDSLACYISRTHKSIAPDIKAFIEDNLRKLDYSHLLDSSKLYVQGNVYNLKEIYNAINAEYFGGRLKLAITWFGKPNQRYRSRVTFGLYHDQLKLIKINRILDSPVYPDYLVAFIIYHEMLHNVCPSYVDERGLHRIHSKEFKDEESKFKYYDLAQSWIREHHQQFFID